MTALSPSPGSFHIDGTVGGGGHTLRILEAANPDGRVLGLDADPRALERTRERLAGYGDRLALRHTNFGSLRDVARDAGFGQVDGVLLDLGLSSYQLAERERGFSFRAEGPLDMRFDPTTGVPASELVATLDEDALTRLIRGYGEEPHARRIARAIVRERQVAPIETADQLAAIVAAATPRPRPGTRRPIHPATRTFQALRIAVNAELDVLPQALEGALDVLKPGRRARRHQLPLTGGPDREALRGRGAPRLHLSAGRAGVCLRTQPAPGTGRRSAPDADRRRGDRQPAVPQRQAARGPAARGMSGHRAYRRREYGRRQKDVRAPARRGTRRRPGCARVCGCVAGHGATRPRGRRPMALPGSTRQPSRPQRSAGSQGR